MASPSPYRTLARLARMLERSCGNLTLPQYRVLGLIADGSERATLLANRLALTKPSVSELIDTLVERGLVERGTEPLDRRAVRLVATKAGKQALRRAEASMAERIEPIIEGCDDPELVRAALAQIGPALDAATDARLATKARA
ncbi:MAG TPA: MarR family transcriptional regulator [Acidimicrobiia bacterium]|jgi:DNA-binding MarR family transcriptional regulator